VIDARCADVLETLERARSAAKRNGRPGEQGEAQAVPIATYGRESVEWLIAGRVPLRAVTLLAGDPGIGKSLLTCAWAGELSRAGGCVLLATAEDSIAATVRPRLEAVEADLNRIHVVRLMREGVEEGLALPDDVGELDRLVGETQAQLVVIDPLMAHLPDNVNSWRDQSVRRALAPLHYLAEEHGCAVIVVAHLNKASGTEALYRVGGSIGIGGAARSALLFARDPNDPDGDQGRQRVLAHFKCNVAPIAPSVAYRVEPTVLPGDDQVSTARLVAHGETDTTGAQLLVRRDEEEAPQLTEALEFLEATLAEGPVKTQEVLREAEEAGIAEKTLRRAKGKLGVKAVQLAGKAHGGWAWELPQSRGHLTPSDGHLTVAEPNSHISDDGHLTGEDDHLRVRWSDGHVGEATPDHLTEEASVSRPPPRPQQVYVDADVPDCRLRVLDVDGDQVRLRVESSNGRAGELLELPVAAFHDLRRMA
jgi:hypothetical protein